MKPEYLVLTINLSILIIAYIFVHPRYAGADFNKLTMNDLAASLTSVLVCGALFWNIGAKFSLMTFNMNWFWFAVVSYFLMELPFMAWYCRKHKIKVIGNVK